jgi:hypothetical protein
MIGLATGSNLNSITGLTISDCNLTAPTVLGIAENFGTTAVSNVSFTPSQSNVSWQQGELNQVSAFVRPSPAYPYATCIGSSLALENCSITSSSKVAAVILEASSKINNLEFNGFAVKGGAPSSQVPDLLNLESGSIGKLVLDSLDTTGIPALISPGQFQNVGSVSGAGVLATGWKFTDAVMANGVPYISASTGLASIKVEGQVQKYP